MDETDTVLGLTAPRVRLGRKAGSESVKVDWCPKQRRGPGNRTE